MKHTHFKTSQVKPVMFLVSILLISFLIHIVAVQANPETIVKVDSNSTSVNVGETVIVNVTIIDVQNLYSLEVILYWNSSLLKLVNVDVRLGQSDGVLYNPIFIVENSTQEGKYALTAMSYSPAPSFNGSGNIVGINFEATSPGYSKLDLETQLYDRPTSDIEPQPSMPIEHTTIDGFCDIIPEIPSTIILTMLMILTTLAVVLYKKISKKTSSHLQYQPQRSKLTFITIRKATKDAG